MADTRTFKDALRELAEAIAQKLAGKADAPGVGNYITDVNAREQFAPKAGTGEGEAYATEGYVTTAIQSKANSADVYTKTEVDEAITNAVPTEEEIGAIVQEYLNNQNSGE